MIKETGVSSKIRAGRAPNRLLLHQNKPLQADLAAQGDGDSQVATRIESSKILP